MFMGLESLPLSSEDTIDARRQVPKGMLLSSIFVSTIAVIHPLVVRLRIASVAIL